MKNQKAHSSRLLAILLVASLFYQCRSVKNTTVVNDTSYEIVELKITPSSTDKTITHSDVPHLVMYKPSLAQDKLLLFLPGTNGVPERGPKKLFKVAAEQGYKVINLSYINNTAVAAICREENLETVPDCTEKFRTQRIYGNQLTTWIPDQPQDAIVNRLVKLLVHLSEVDKDGNWDVFLGNGAPKWEAITVSGQSQGGGMAAFIAKDKKVDRLITFSGGWDFYKKGVIAKWYSSTSATPLNRWYGIYHVEEPMAETLAKTYEAMAIPESQIFPLNLKIREGKKAHGEGIRNIVYKEMWKELFTLDK